MTRSAQFEVIGFDADDTLWRSEDYFSIAEQFFAERGGDWPVVLDHDQIDVAFGVALVPETWIVDPSGVVQVRIIARVSVDTLNVTMQQLREAYG